MANEYLVNSSDLTSVANAIREKGETTEQLVFPSGFVTAIEGIKGGVELNFEVVGGTTKPSSPKGNTIWVDTPNEITGWGFGAEAEKPESPAPGMVWFATSANSIIKFNALKEDSIIVTPSSAHQYISGAWNSISVVKIYQNGEWVDWWDGTLYNAGDMYTHVTDGWIGRAVTGNQNYTSTTPDVSLSSDMATVSFPTNKGWLGGLYLTVRKIDLTGFNTLVFKGYADPGDQYGYANVVVCPDLAIWTSYPQVQIGTENKEYILDVSVCSGEYYIGIGVLASNNGVKAYMESLKLI